jgi:type IV pilus assembly protein PilA
LGDGWKTAISEYYANTGNWPAQANLAGTCVSAGKYETGVTVTAGGVIQITYGNQANAKITGATLAIVPYTNSNNDVLWRCGTAASPSTGATVASGATPANSILPQYLPTSCHS